MESTVIKNGHQIKSTPCWCLYQQLVDEVFGKGKITIKKAKDNNVIGTLKYLDDFQEFKENFKKRLERLKTKYEHTKDYNKLLEQVKQVADPNNWEGAYAELVAYDILYNDAINTDLKLDVTLDASKSYAGDLGGKATNEDVYVPDYNLYFDVKCFADTTGNILKELIEEAINKTGQKRNCHILPKYPLDDAETPYQNNRRQLLKELSDYIDKNKSNTQCKTFFQSNVIKSLSYSVLWGSGINSGLGEYNPYVHAEKTRHIMIKRYMKKFMKNEKFMIVLVNFPWYNNRISSFANCDEIYYRALARRTFCGYKHTTESISEIRSDYTGTDSLYEISTHLSGIIIIDDHSIETDTYSCHIYLNPNAVNKIAGNNLYLESIIRCADKHSRIDDFTGDNY